VRCVAFLYFCIFVCVLCLFFACNRQRHVGVRLLLLASSTQPTHRQCHARDLACRSALCTRHLARCTCLSASGITPSAGVCTCHNNCRDVASVRP
jgi:hypothetical protein